MLLARDLIDLWGYSMEGYHTDTFVLEAQVIEVKEKPSHPIGRIFVDAFGNTPEYEDKGMRKRALIALGKKDIGHHDSLIPKLKGITVEGSSSDHVILDVTDAAEEIKVGDIIEFELYYQQQNSSLTRDIVGLEVLLRWRHPVRGGRPAAGHPQHDARWRGHRCAVDGPGRRQPRPARRHLRRVRHPEPARLHHRYRCGHDRRCGGCDRSEAVPR